MKKLFTLIAAALFATGMWAVDPTLAIGTTAQTSSSFLGVYTEQGITLSSSASYSSGAVQLGNTPSSYDQHYFEVLSSSDIIDSISFLISGNGSNKSIQAPVFAWENTATGNTADTYAILDAVTVTANSYAAAKWFTYALTAVDVKCARIYRTTKGISSINPEYTGSSTALGSGQTIKIYGIKVYTHASCTSPETPLSLSSDAAETVYVGDVITFSTAGGNGGEITIEGANSETITDNKWTATAGEHTFTASQEKNGDYCDQSSQLVLTVYEKAEVETCTITGPTAGYAGYTLTYTATAENATTYEWYVDGVATNNNSATFNYTAVKGNHAIKATATNEFTTTPVESNTINVAVTKLCGELIKVSATAYNAATATGFFSGTTSASMSSKDSEKSVYEDLTGYKLNTKNQHLGITFNAGQTLQAGDVATVFVTTVSAKLQLFADKGTTLIGETDNVVQGENQIILGSAANGANGIYVYRTEAAGADMNPFVAYVSVTRPCEESDNNNASVTINGEAAEKSGTVFNYTLSNSYADPTVDVVITLEHPLATLMEDHAASFTMPTPEVGTPSVETFKVKAENGEQASYSIFVNKAASLNDDATLSALSVEGYTLDPAFNAEVTAYTITKAYGAENPATSAVTATPNDANANAEVVLVDDVFTITVTAEDGETKKEYTITVNEAAARKALLRATFSFASGDDINLVDGFIANGNIDVPYIGETQPTFVSVDFWQKDGDPTAEIVDGKLVVTGEDSQQDEYTITYHQLTPKTLDYEEETFTAVPSYIYSVYGWDSSKGVKFSKDVEEATTHRISEGRDRIYIALPAAGQVILTGGSAGARPVKITVNGNVSAIKSTPNAGETIKLSLNKSKANFIGIESNGNNGDAGFTKLQLQQDYPTALDNTEDNAKAVKMIENGQIVIIKNGVRYNVLGAVLK